MEDRSQDAQLGEEIAPLSQLRSVIVYIYLLYCTDVYIGKEITKSRQSNRPKEQSLGKKEQLKI